MEDNQTHHIVICSQCGLKIPIDLQDNTKQEVSEHLKACIPKLDYFKSADDKDWTMEIPYETLTIDEFKCLKDAICDADRQVVIVRLVA